MSYYARGPQPPRGRCAVGARGRWTMRRRIWGVLLAVALVAGLSPAGALGQEKIGMTFWSWRGEDRAFYEGMIKKFEAQNPGVSIQFQTYKPTEYNTVLSA